MTAPNPNIVGIDVSKTVGVSMKFALESLPELIGSDDYADLCELLGMAEWHRQDIPTGADFARRIRERIFRLQHDRRMADGSRRAGELL